MSERSERLFVALSEIGEQKIEEASPCDRTSRFQWKRWGVIAAALVLAAGLGNQFLSRPGGGDSTSGNSAAGGAGADGSSTFMSYAGPVFPLTLREADGDITADREITLDFSPWIGHHSGDIQVTDAYTLTNHSAEDRTVSVLYPFAGTLYDLGEISPTLTADGAELSAVLHAGGYTGTFYGGKGPESPGRWNLAELNSWEGYKTLLEGEGYRQSAFEDYPNLSDTPAIVYKFTDPQGDGSQAATIGAAFNLDYTRTMVLSYAFNGGKFDYEANWMGQSYFIPRAAARDYNRPRYLIVLGEDVQNMTIQGYKDGGCEAGDERDFTVNVQRYETSLEDILREAAHEQYDWWGASYVDFEMYFGLMKENLLAYGILSDYPAERYHNGHLDDLDFANMDRVFYLETEVTVPAGGSVRLSAEMRKEGSCDFYCAHTENQGVYGYDMVTKLGSSLTCTRQTAVLEDRGQIEIVRQNFGFDLANGVNRVALDPDQEHYYLEVKRLLKE